MHAFVQFRLPDGRTRDLAPGDIIGRAANAALCLNAPYISEAHAMVSLRGSQMKLIGLRGRFSVDGKSASEAALAPGMRIVLASRLPLVVSAVHLPQRVLAIEADDLAPHILGSVSSLRARDASELVVGFVPDADAYFWTSGDAVWARIGGPEGEAGERRLAEGDVLVVGEREFRVVAVPLEAVALETTIEGSQLGPPLHLILNYDTVHLHQAGERLVVDGIPARILSELVQIRAPVGWEEVARQIWGREPIDPTTLRDRWDSSLARLRRKLKEGRVRIDLVRSTKSGQIEVLLGPSDTIEDRM